MTREEQAIREQFPLICGSSEAYLDNAATTQKPQCVIDAVADYYKADNANPMRGLYALSLRATEAYENARTKA
ncbi:MAG: aminotransferase class V-fold PLP-dependent enzyme, partial [Oscillospiraceae bacterium]|nr:aminotransferase class V-fold PLP-dependent enzyme [Oscillospiraceae bacterium]